MSKRVLGLVSQVNAVHTIIFFFLKVKPGQALRVPDFKTIGTYISPVFISVRD